MNPDELRELLLSEQEFALLDVREQGVHYRGHPFFAISLPLSRLELKVADLIPRKQVRLIVLDGGDERLAHRAAAKLRELGYPNVEVLEGGCTAWAASGGELFSGINVPSKAFGEFVEHHYETPRIPPTELQALIASGRKLVVLDSRPAEEFRLMNIPAALSVPGAELVWRTPGLVADDDTLIVVNCAGRTRSIIGCQSLRNAGWKNVVALKDGTMGWNLAGLECETGQARMAPAPDSTAADRARRASAEVARRFGVQTISAADARAWLNDQARTTYLFDVRTAEEFEAGHLAGASDAPGGQLVQSTDEFVGVRNARIILVDPQKVRAEMTASWLNQMGWREVRVLAGGTEGWPIETGRPEVHSVSLPDWAAIEPAELATILDKVRVLDLSTSLQYRAGHVPGAWWAVRSRLEEAHAHHPEATDVVLTGDDPAVAALAAPEAATLWPDAKVRIVAGGNRAWRDAGFPIEAGLTHLTTSTDDVWYKPYDYEDPAEYVRQARAYLDWEVGLVEQIKRDPSIRFQLGD